MAYIEIDVDLDEFSTEDLLQEILYRYEGQNAKDKSEILSFFIEHFEGVEQNNIIEMSKINYFFEHLDRFTEEDLQKIVENKS